MIAAIIMTMTILVIINDFQLHPEKEEFRSKNKAA